MRQISRRMERSASWFCRQKPGFIWARAINVVHGILALSEMIIEANTGFKHDLPFLLVMSRPGDLYSGMPMGHQNSFESSDLHYYHVSFL